MEKKNRNGLWKLVRMAGLAFAIPFELAAGPFVGYFMGVYLHNRLGAHRYVMYVLILMGIAVGIYNASDTIRAMVKMSREK